MASGLAAGLASGSGSSATASLVTLQVAPRGPGSISTSTAGGADLDNGGVAIAGPCDQNEGEGSCHWAFPKGTEVSLSAQPGEGAAGFAGWSSPDCPGTGSCTVTLDDDLTSIVALFDPLTLGVRLSSDDVGTVTSKPAGIDCSVDGDDGCFHGFAPNTAVQLTVNGGDFKGWNGPCTPADARTCTIVVDDEKTWAGATFGDDTPPTLETTIDVRFQLRKKGDGNGIVTAPNIDCGSQCAVQLGYGKTLTLTAAPDGASTFGGWGGVCPAADHTCTLAVGPITRMNVAFERDTTPPSAPAHLEAVAATRISVSLAWSAATDDLAVTGYRVYRDDTTVGDVDARQFTVGGLSCGRTYALGVDAVDSAGNRSAKATVTASTAPCALSAHVAGVLVGHIGAGSTISVLLRVNRATTVRLTLRRGRRQLARGRYLVRPGTSLLRLKVPQRPRGGRARLRIVVIDPDGGATHVLTRGVRLR